MERLTGTCRRGSPAPARRALAPLPASSPSWPPRPLAGRVRVSWWEMGMRLPLFREDQGGKSWFLLLPGVAGAGSAPARGCGGRWGGGIECWSGGGGGDGLETQSQRRGW